MKPTSVKNKNDPLIKIIPIIWILLGLLQLPYGVYNYQEEFKWRLVINEYNLIKNIFFAILSCIIGFRLLNENYKVYSLLSLYGLLIPVILFWKLLYTYINYGIIWNIRQLFHLDYFIYLFILITVNRLNASSVENEQVTHFWSHKITILFRYLI